MDSRRPLPPHRPYERERVPPPPPRHYNDVSAGGGHHPSAHRHSGLSSSSSSATRRSRSPDLSRSRNGSVRTDNGYRDRDRQPEREREREREPFPPSHSSGRHAESTGRNVPPPRDYQAAGGYPPRGEFSLENQRRDDGTAPGRGYVPPPRDVGASSNRDRHDRDRNSDPSDRKGQYRDDRNGRESSRRDVGSKRDDRGQTQGRNGDHTRMEDSTARHLSYPTSSGAQEVDEGAEDGSAQETEEDMMAAMGFGGFGTTKNHKVDGNATGSANVKKERTWRQYMNRKGGFNRPLDALPKEK